MAPSDDKTRVLGEGDSDGTAAASGASRCSAWTLHRILVLARRAGILGCMGGQGGRSEPPSAEGIRSFEGRTVVAVVAVCIGAIAAGSLADQSLNAPPSDGPVYDPPQTASISVLASNSRFSPTTFNITIGRVTKITVLNEDDGLHTFTYSNNGTPYSHDLLPSGGVTRFYVLFSSVGDVPFASTPSSDVGMNGTMRIVAPQRARRILACRSGCARARYEMQWARPDSDRRP